MESPTQLNAAQSMSFYEMNGADRNNPEKVAGKFEAMFYRILFKQMRDGQLADPLLSSSSIKQMEEMRHDELAEHLGAMGHLGIKDLILSDLDRRSGLGPNNIADGHLLKSP